MTTPRFRGRLWPILGGLFVLGLWLVSAAANFHAGISLSNSPAISATLGLASVCADGMKVVALFIAAAALANRRPVPFILGLVVFTLCAAWSMRSATQFVSSTLEGKAAQQTQMAKLQKSELELLSIKTQRAGFLAQQSTRVSGGAASRRDALDANRQTAKDFQALTRDIEEQQQLLKEAQAVTPGDPIAQLFGLEDRGVILVSALFFALLLEVVSGTGFWLIAQSRLPKVRPAPLPLQPIQEMVTRLSPVAEPPVYKDIKILIEAPSVTPPEEPDPKPTKKKPNSELNTPANVVPIRKEGNKLNSIMKSLFESGSPRDRMALREFSALVNAHLPRSEWVVEPQLVVKTLVPALCQAISSAEKRRVGGRCYVYGVRPRSVTTPARMA